MLPGPRGCEGRDPLVPATTATISPAEALDFSKASRSQSASSGAAGSLTRRTCRSLHVLQGLLIFQAHFVDQLGVDHDALL